MATMIEFAVAVVTVPVFADVPEPVAVEDSPLVKGEDVLAPVIS